jgi:hypothetical protein
MVLMPPVALKHTRILTLLLLPLPLLGLLSLILLLVLLCFSVHDVEHSFHFH